MRTARCFRTIWFAVVLLGCAHVPTPTSSYLASTGTEGRTCEELLNVYTAAQAHRLIYTPATGAWRWFNPYDERRAEAAYPLEGQRIVVCIDSDDWRDTFSVSVGAANREQQESTSPRSVDVGAQTAAISGRDVGIGRPIAARLGGPGPRQPRTTTQVAANLAGRATPEQVQALREYITRMMTRAELMLAMIGAESTLREGNFVYPSWRDISTQVNASRPALTNLLPPDNNLLSYADLVARESQVEGLERELAEYYRELTLAVIMSATESLEGLRTRLLGNALTVFQSDAPLGGESRSNLAAATERLMVSDGCQTESRLEAVRSDTARRRIVIHVPLPALYAGDTNQRNKCGFEHYVNGLLPSWIWLSGGSLRYFADSDENVARAGAVDGGASTGEGLAMLEEQQDSLRRTLSELADSIARTWRLVEFMDEILVRLRTPRRVYDLNSFSQDRIVTISVERTHHALVLQGGNLSVSTQAATSTHVTEVHGLSWVNVEPGLVLSTRTNPTYSVGPNAFGDQVIQSTARFQDQLLPVVFARFNLCPVDERLAPLFRRCRSGTNFSRFQGWSLLEGWSASLGLTPSAGILQNVFIGLNFQPAPILTIGAGVHLGSWNTLREGYRAGDAFPRGSADLPSVVEQRFGASWYFSLSVGGDVWSRLRGFRLQ